MQDLPLVRIGLGLMALIALIAVGVNLGQRVGRSDSSASPVVQRAAAPADGEVDGHWRELAPVLVLLDSAVAIGDPERRQEALKAAEDLLERAEERAPGAGELPGSPRREYRTALERLRDAVDVAEEPGTGPEELRAVAEARTRLEQAAGGPPARP
ncbi:MAG TPA: hypothetical protein VHG51_11970 [Longimicrobiaceae bacterium]|nr:hypothetical protein [Longimicrobiaceae bacterium]